MARYIDIEGAGIGKANREQFLVPEFADGWNAVLKILEKEPTADVVEVVRCKNCIHFEAITLDSGISVGFGNCKAKNGINLYPKENDFCSYGERSDT